MPKRNNRNIRLSDEIIEMIESQQGENFTQKFENLVTRCMWELPQKEKQLKELDKEIRKKRDEYGRLCVEVHGYVRKVDNIQLALLQLTKALDDRASL